MRFIKGLMLGKGLTEEIVEASDLGFDPEDLMEKVEVVTYIPLDEIKWVYYADSEVDGELLQVFTPFTMISLRRTPELVAQLERFLVENEE